MPVFSRSSCTCTDLSRSRPAIGRAARYSTESTLLRPTISRTADSLACTTASSGLRFSNRKARASFSRYCTVKRMSTMFSSCVSIDESRSPVAGTGVLRPISTERSCVTGTVSCAWNGYGKRHWMPASTRVAVAAEGRDHRLLAFLHDEHAAAQPDQHHHAGDQADADAGALHVGLERRPAIGAAARRCGRALAAALAAEQAAELAVEVAPQLVQVGRAVVAPAVVQHQRVAAAGVARCGRRQQRAQQRRRRAGDIAEAGRSAARGGSAGMVWGSAR